MQYDKNYFFSPQESKYPDLLSNPVATSHVYLFDFKFIKI